MPRSGYQNDTGMQRWGKFYRSFAPSRRVREKKTLKSRNFFSLLSEESAGFARITRENFAPGYFWLN
jgi:hypothetical protein